jgi:hypothetical protein
MNKEKLYHLIEYIVVKGDKNQSLPFEIITISKKPVNTVLNYDYNHIYSDELTDQLIYGLCSSFMTTLSVKIEKVDNDRAKYNINNMLTYTTKVKFESTENLDNLIQMSNNIPVVENVNIFDNININFIFEYADNFQVKPINFNDYITIKEIDVTSNI